MKVRDILYEASDSSKSGADSSVSQDGQSVQMSSNGWIMHFNVQSLKVVDDRSSTKQLFAKSRQIREKIEGLVAAGKLDKEAGVELYEKMSNRLYEFGNDVSSELQEELKKTAFEVMHAAVSVLEAELHRACDITNNHFESTFADIMKDLDDK